MRVIGIIIILGIFVIPTIIFWYDKVFDFVAAIKRYHIGRWNDFESWEKAVVKRAIIWGKHCPIVRVEDKSSYELIKRVTGKYSDFTVQSWQEAELALGLIEYSDKNHMKCISYDFLSKFISENGNWKCKIDRVDYALLAYALLKLCKNPRKIYPAMNEMIRIIELNLCEDGMISYSLGKNTTIRYVDTLGMVCPFLVLYGKMYDNKRYIKMAIDQIEKFRNIGVLENYSLPCHAYDKKNSLPIGIYGWGRGTAWYFLALIDTYRELDQSNEKKKLSELISEAAENYFNFQSADGGFSTILQAGGQYDSSVTAAMAYFYGICAIIYQNEKYSNISKQCLKKLSSVTMKSGAIDLCQGDTHGIGIFSQVFDIMPFAQGLVLRALSVNSEEFSNE